MAERNFDAERSTDRGEGHTFILAGHTFHTLPGLPVSVLLETTETPTFEGVIKFIRRMITKADRPAFDALIGNEEAFVEANELIEVSNWILEVISDRPTEGSSSSSTGPDDTSGSSAVTPIAKAATGKK